MQQLDCEPFFESYSIILTSILQMSAVVRFHHTPLLPSSTEIRHLSKINKKMKN